MIKLIISIMLLSLFSGSVWAENKENPFEELRKEIHTEGLNQTLLKISLENKEATSKTTFRKFVTEHNQSILEWQHTSNIMSFLLVFILVVCGLIFSYKQFEKDLKDNKSSVTTVEISKEGIKLSSSVIGLALLFMSLAFFYLYLDKIYEIEAVNFEAPVNSNPEEKNK